MTKSLFFGGEQWGFTITFPNVNYDYGESDLKSDLKSDFRVFELIKENPFITIPELCDKTGMSRSGIKKVLEKLKSEKRIIRVGPDKGGHWDIIGEK